MDHSPTSWPAPLRRLALELPTSRIGDVAAIGRGDRNVIPLWFGESDLQTPKFICDAAAAAMHEGHTFYTWQRGIPELRQALADYTNRLYGGRCTAENITVTGSGMQAILLSCQTIIEPGDNIVVVSPVWPNIVAAARVMGGEAREVSLRLVEGKWHLDIDQLNDAIDQRTRAIFVNSPGNPTGWTMENDQHAAMLEIARKRNIWIIADEVYARIVYDRPVAPSFLHVAREGDPLIIVQSFSKPWAMTGWRLGWVTSSNAMGEQLAKLIQFNLSGSPAFLQFGALTAIEKGESFVAQMVDRCRAGREMVFQRLAANPRIRVARPDAAFYAFLAVDGMKDSLAFASKMVRDAKLGMAPGVAFGRGGEGHLRLCFASAPERMNEALDRFETFLAKN